MMFADTERIDADVLGENSLGHDIAQRLCLGERAPILVNGDVAERIQAHLEHAGLTGFRRIFRTATLRVETVRQMFRRR